MSGNRDFLASVRNSLTQVWHLVSRTGLERAEGREPRYLTWFFGTPLVSWTIATVIVGTFVGSSVYSAVPLLVLGVAILNVGATCRVLFLQGGALRSLLAALEDQSEQPPAISSVHEAWRARSATWGYLASLITLTFLASIRFLPSWALGDLFPPDLLPLYSLAVLALTVTMIAVLSQYTSRTAAADARATSRDLRRLSSELMQLSERTSAQLSSDLSGLTTRLTESLAQTTRETNAVLAELTNSVRELATSAAAQANAMRAAQAATEAVISSTQRASQEHADALRNLERARAEELAMEAARLRPRVALRLRVQGVILHHIRLDLYDAASQAVGVVVEVRGGLNDLVFNIGSLPARVPRAVDLGDVGRFPDAGRISITLQYSDLAGRQYLARQSYDFVRSRSIIGTTAGWNVNPTGWVWAEAHLDIPVDANVPALQ
jgi:hypothetical protein